VSTADDTGHSLRIGSPEREAAREALDTHLVDQRLDPREHERRVQACDLAVTQAELLRIFADLPAPHPELPSVPVAAPAREEDEDMPPVAVAGCLLIGLGIPVAVVLGFVYGAWWTLGIPVLLTSATVYIDRLIGLRSGRRTAAAARSRDRSRRGPRT
jgi:hypothetical protein